ncbi:MAG: tetratricopeptide repeat protein, partial [Pseudomonadota bacterium]
MKADLPQSLSVKRSGLRPARLSVVIAALGLILVNIFNQPIISSALADHPIDVQRLSSEGEHFKALTLYDVLPDRRLGEDTHIAAAKSAWALGLARQAADIFDAVLRDNSLGQDDRARLTLSRGVIEYQEGRYQEAALFAEKAASLIPQGAPLRGRALLLWGQSLVRDKAYATAEEKLTMALNEA